MVAAELSRPAAAGWLRSRPKLRAALQRNVTGWLFILPALIGFGIFYLYPTLRAVEISLTDWNLMRAPKFIGFDNYLKLIDDPRFWQSARITVAYVLYNIPLQTVLGLAWR